MNLSTQVSKSGPFRFRFPQMYPHVIQAPSAHHLVSGARGQARVADVSLARALTRDANPRLQQNLDVIAVLTDFGARFCTSDSAFFLLTEDDFVFCRGYELQLAMLTSYFEVQVVDSNCKPCSR